MSRGPLLSAQADKDRLTIRAPRAGNCGDWHFVQWRENFDVGMSSQPGQVIVELIEDAVLEISGDVHERLAAQIEVGLRARMTAEAAGGIEFTGVVETVGQSVRRKFPIFTGKWSENCESHWMNNPRI